ncbi:MAG: segregation/condensation protein A [Desulfuromonadaceae bacterium]|nr:segregation/condensation protein A [Desulfuromonadaceae bacterium]
MTADHQSHGDENLSLLDGFNKQYSIHIDKFEGPMDLLLHLVKKNEMDIYDISISVITRQYLEFIKFMKDLNLEVAGDFLVMAATLLQIKSTQLLPLDDQEDIEAEEVDPRDELVRRLLEYQQFKEAGMVIGARALLGREVFQRSAVEPFMAASQSVEGPLEVSLFELVDAFRVLLQKIPVESFHDVSPGDSLSIADCINEILSLLQDQEMIEFEQLVRDEFTRERVIVSFLAILELCRLKLIKIFQAEQLGSIWFLPAVTKDLSEVEFV